MRAECGTNIPFSRSHQTLKSVINCFDKSSHSKLHPRTTESGGELTRYQPQQQAGEAGVRSSIRRQLRVVTKRCWVPVCEWRTAGPRVYKHARVASVRRGHSASVTGSVKTVDSGEGHLVSGHQSLASDWSLLTQHWPLIGESWAQRESLLVRMCQAWSQNNHEINDPKCLDGHLLKMGTIIICEKEPKCFHSDDYR